MADFKLIGKSFGPPDLEAKITGRAKYAEDFRAEGIPHATATFTTAPASKKITTMSRRRFTSLPSHAARSRTRCTPPYHPSDSRIWRTGHASRG